MFVSFPLDVQSPLVWPNLRTLTSMAKTFTVYFEICCEVGLGFQILQGEFVFSHYLCAIMRVHVASFNPEKIHPQTLGKSIFMFVFLLLPAPFLDCSLSSFLNLCQYNNYTLYFHCCIQTVLCSN